MAPPASDPRRVREDLGLAGSRVLFVKVGEGHYRLLARTGSLRDLAGVLQRPGQAPRTVEEMQEGIADAAATAGARNEPGA
ncbi:AbrB family transcriptional regulator [Ornithinimicrobium sp. F0845]|uniref:AbrB family transcriptional regulator n=1 Tax=Ornithinimicrobium sp. F0845 TaxID=2926412 RepID=UPI001FF6708F|nr:AbrB family transcriptional regulator [Ornithinimicrobium sp. F0845]MCK0110580.1 AbrB family transcriptional regulator [Ornithinimicrobium sp. F0845]